MDITLHHPVTGNTIVVGDERIAAVHQESGWEIVPSSPADDAAPVRPADDAPPRKWLAYAAEIGLDVDPATVGSVEELIALVDAQDGLPDHAEDLIAWIGQDPDRARQADTEEQTRPHPRKTVTEHIQSVLNTESQED